MCWWWFCIGYFWSIWCDSLSIWDTIWCELKLPSTFNDSFQEWLCGSFILIICKPIKQIYLVRNVCLKLAYITCFPIALVLTYSSSDRDIEHQQHQLSTELLNGPVVSYQTKFCLDSCTPFPQFVSTSRRISPLFSQYHPEDAIA